jgi:hypothetical protein
VVAVVTVWKLHAFRTYPKAAHIHDVRCFGWRKRHATALNVTSFAAQALS